MSLSKLPSGSLSGQVEANKKEFREFAKFVTQFMQVVQNRFRDTQSAFATAMHNHEVRIKELEAKLGITPQQEMQGELEQVIIESAGPEETIDTPTVAVQPDLPGIEEKPVEVAPEESKIRFHKDYD